MIIMCSFINICKLELLTVDFLYIDQRGVDSLEGGIVLLCGASESVQRAIDGEFRFGEFALRSLSRGKCRESEL